jgi:hypothetical protein
MKSAAWVVGLLLCPCLAGAYSVSPPKWPGSVKGTFKVVGELPPQAPVPVERDVPACGKDIAPDTLVVSQGGLLQGALVWLEDVPSGKEFPRRSVGMDLRNCRVAPHLMTLGLGDELTVGNVDSVFHQVNIIQAGPDGAARQKANVGMPVGGQRLRFKQAQAGWLLVAGLGAHPWMAGGVRVFEHPYHAVTGSEGSFELRDVPPGQYTLHIWHERFGDVTRPVEVKAGYPSRVDVEFPAANLSAKSLLPIP